jgi:hypothetical protein
MRGILGVGLVSLAAVTTALPTPASADTDPTALVGEGGSFLTPVTDLLLGADTGLAPLNPSYNDANLNDAITDFIGTAPNTFGTDFVVSERPLSPNDTATAKANGRTFAYVPFAATPVAVATLAVCNPSGLSGNSTDALCQDIPLSVPLVAGLFTANLTSAAPGLPLNLSGWGDARLTQANGDPIPNSGIYQASTLEPSAENSALMALIDSDPDGKALLDNALNNPSNTVTTTSDTPSDTWPFHENHAVVGGDAGLIGKELSINAETNAPSELETWTGLGSGAAGPDDVFPLSSVWAGAPQGTPWNIPTAAIQNAAGKFVPPSEAAAAASESDATMDSATNLVTFVPNATNETAYNNYMMVESYLVVPTTGLTPAKASKLAQYIRFAVGPVAQSDEETLGSAPPTATMIAADLKVATQLDIEAGAISLSSSSDPTSTSTSTTTSSTTSTTVATASAATGSTGNTGSGGSSTGSSLAATGAEGVVPLLGVGAVLLVIGVGGRRRSRRLRRAAGQG